MEIMHKAIHLYPVNECKDHIASISVKKVKSLLVSMSCLYTRIKNETHAPFATHRRRRGCFNKTIVIPVWEIALLRLADFSTKESFLLVRRYLCISILFLLIKHSTERHKQWVFLIKTTFVIQWIPGITFAFFYHFTWHVLFCDALID